jgi:hypothetical protein
LWVEGEQVGQGSRHVAASFSNRAAQIFGYLPMRRISSVSHGVAHGSRATETHGKCGHVRTATDVWHPAAERSRRTQMELSVLAIVSDHRICGLPGVSVDLRW